jgi:outer membrane protein OmpA-like peptidoglycan-associated protein/tetratricopeptide (TPR) repeat protein
MSRFIKYSLILGWLIITVVVSFQAAAQPVLSTKNKKAIELYTESDNYRVRREYDKAIPLLLEAIEKDKKFEEAYYRLALIYRAQENLPMAIQYLQQGLALTQNTPRSNSFLYDLTQTELRLGAYQDAADYASQFLQIEKTDGKRITQVTLWKKQTEYALLHEKDILDYKITVLSNTVNAFPMQYFPVVTADQSQLIFTARFGGSRNENEDLVIAHKNTDGSWMPPVSISENINTIRREGACTISADGRHLIFTVCGERGCDLFESRKSGKVWSVPKSLGPAINTASWDAQPSLSADGRELYFVSDRPGGRGGYDIWYSQLRDGLWVKAVNLGNSINTPFDEISPYIHVNNKTLYVVSNGFPGFGGYDIYMAEKKELDWATPVNLGKPLNDHQDQYSFIVTNDGEWAYYSREESKNRSRLYKIKLPQNVVTKYKGNVVKGKVMDVKTNTPLQARIELFNLQQNESVSVVESDSVTGNYLMVLPGGTEYALYVSKTSYLFQSLHFNYIQSDEVQPVIKDVGLVALEKNASIILNNIFFDIDKYELKQSSITELKEVIKFLQLNPSIKIEISGHTDNSGAEQYNRQLSLKRAAAVSDYLKDQGIDPGRLTQRGYGAQQPLRSNDTDENRQFNRRIEFKIL